MLMHLAQVPARLPRIANSSSEWFTVLMAALGPVALGSTLHDEVLARTNRWESSFDVSSSVARDLLVPSPKRLAVWTSGRCLSCGGLCETVTMQIDKTSFRNRFTSTRVAAVHANKTDAGADRSFSTFCSSRTVSFSASMALMTV